MNDASVSRHTLYRTVIDGVQRVVFDADRAERLSEEGHEVTATVVR